MTDLVKRLGMFAISATMLEDDPEAVAQFLSGMLIVRAEMVWHDRAIHYTAACKSFDIVDPSMTPPWYKAEITVHHDPETGKVTRSITQWVKLA